ncbi:MAG: hypothetical protein HDS03_01385 [Bacteroides sp.]|nr:hypothetical protein [Bacteroides sp.]
MSEKICKFADEEKGKGSFIESKGKNFTKKVKRSTKIITQYINNILIKKQ